MLANQPLSAPVLLFLFLVAGHHQSASAFQSLLLPTSAPTRSSISILSAAPSPDSSQLPYEGFERAVTCAKHDGLCDVDELLKLADELESYSDSFFFEFQEQQSLENDCEKEVLDRLDVVDLLRAEAETTMRRDTLEFENLFTANVENHKQNKSFTGGEHHDDDDEEECPTKDVIDSISNYYECVYSKTLSP